MSHPTWRVVNSKGVSDGLTNTVQTISLGENTISYAHKHFSQKTCHGEYVIFFDKKKNLGVFYVIARD